MHIHTHIHIDLSNKVEELTLNNEHQLRLKEMDFNDRNNDISKKFELQLQQEKEKFGGLSEDRDSDETKRKKKLDVLDTGNDGQLNGIETKYKAKLLAEGVRYKSLLSEVEATHTHWNEENVALVNSHQAYLKDLCFEYEEKLAEEHTEQKR